MGSQKILPLRPQGSGGAGGPSFWSDLLPSPVCLTPPLRGFPRNICNGAGAQKLVDGQKFDDMSVGLDTILALDRRTDRRIFHNNIALCIHRMLTRDKKTITHEETV